MTRSMPARGKRAATAAALLLVPLVLAAVFYHQRITHWWRWGEPRPLAPDLERLLAWLPEDTQTLIVARDTVVRSKSEDPRSLGALERFQSWSSGILASLKKGAYAAELEGRRLALSIEGSRKFRSPVGLGLMPYEGCHVLVFDGDLGSAGDRMMALALGASKRPLSLGKHPVAVIEETMEQDTWNLFLMRISSNALLLATDEQFLEEVLRRREERSARRALPDDLPEWREIDRAASFWALRHYDRGDAAADPSSPFGGKKGFNCPDDAAVGLAFCLTIDSSSSSPRARLVYFSASPDSARIIESCWNEFSKVQARMRPLREGAIEVVPALDNPVAVSMGLFGLLIMFGHGIFV